MKYCLRCTRDYADETLNYCLEDGTPLRFASSADEPATAIMSGRSGDQQISLLHNSQPEIAGATNSIAVLPFVNMSADADNEYFCDGLAEELLNALAKILNEFSAAGETQYVSPVNMAKIHVGLGDHEKLSGSLELPSRPAVKLPWFISDPCLRPIWNDPRFHDLVKRIGLPQISRSRKL